MSCTWGTGSGRCGTGSDLQKEYEAIICVVDYHAITQPYEPEQFRQRTLDMARWILACGIDPEQAHLFVQSDVPEHTELCWVLNSVTPFGELGRMTQFKDKSEQHRHNVNVGLFDYPVLQAADILLYKAAAVPVGEDQVQHVELSRMIARKFNARYGDTFPEPKPVLTKASRIIGLDGESKMSKSKGNTIPLSDDADAIWEKLKPAKTDPARMRRKDPGTPEKCNIWSLHLALSGDEDRAQVYDGCKTAAIGCFDCKKILAKNMDDYLAPIRERAADLDAKPERLQEILHAGAEWSRKTARETMAEVREKLGLMRGRGLNPGRAALLRQPDDGVGAVVPGVRGTGAVGPALGASGDGEGAVRCDEPCATCPGR